MRNLVCGLQCAIISMGTHTWEQHREGMKTLDVPSRGSTAGQYVPRAYPHPVWCSNSLLHLQPAPFRLKQSGITYMGFIRLQLLQDKYKPMRGQNFNFPYTKLDSYQKVLIMPGNSSRCYQTSFRKVNRFSEFIFPQASKLWVLPSTFSAPPK